MPERVLVLAPTGRDSQLVRGLLHEAGYEAAVCPSFDHFLEALEEGPGAAVLAEEGMPPAALERLVSFIDRQPAWSDLPFILLTLPSAARADALFTALGPRANLRLLERPLHAAVLLAAVRSAVRERRRQYQVRQLLAELQEADKRKTDFMALLGHELRNPLASIRTAVQLIQRRAGDPAAMERMGGVLDRQTDNITRMLDDLMEISRVAQGKIRVEPEPTDLRQLVAEYLSGLRARPETEGRVIRAELPDHPVVLDLDPVRMEQVVANLVVNALKYTPAPGGVHVSLREEGDEVLIEVKDEGIGIDKEMLPRIFEAFMQVDGARQLSQGGLGLGLPLVRSLVEMHGGSIHAHSDGANTGSAFTVRLPRQPLPH